MSWSASLPGPVALEQIKPESFNTSPAELDEGPKEQFEVAVDAARDIIESGAVGSEKRFTVSLGGHANEDHEPAEGWANDAISVSISQASD